MDGSSLKGGSGEGALDVGLMAWFAVTRGAIEQQIGFLPCIVDTDKNIGINRIRLIKRARKWLPMLLTMSSTPCPVFEAWTSAATTRGPNSQRAKAGSPRDSQVASCMLPGN